MEGQRNLKCSLGHHRWTTRDYEVFTCFRCEKQRTAGKALRCRLGRHRWNIVRTDDGDAYRQCLFCRKRQKLVDWHDDTSFGRALGEDVGRTLRED